MESCNYKKQLGKSNGAEGGTRTPMGLLPLDPETSVCNMVCFSMTIFIMARSVGVRR